MLVIREITDEHMVVGTKRNIEFVGLLFCGIGLLTVGLALLSVIEHLEWKLPVPSLLYLSQYPLTIGAAGLVMVFMQRRFIFYRPNQQIYFKQGLSKDKISKFSEYVRIELLESKAKNAVLSLVAVDGRKIIITRGACDAVRTIAECIADYLQLPLETAPATMLKPPSNPPALPPPVE
jgi:hypothetical protein